MTAVTPRTAYLGPEASFSHQAAVEALPHTSATPLPSFRAILKALQESNAEKEDAFDYAVLPIENSTNGSVVQALDLLAQCGLDSNTSEYPEVEAIDEYYLEVHHCLFVRRDWAQQRLDKQELASLPIQADNQSDNTPDSPSSSHLKHILAKLNLKALHTHPQVWGQCNNILSAFLPPGVVDRIDTSSTSAAASFIASHAPTPTSTDPDEGGIAAISSSLAGAKHTNTLICVARNIEDEPGANTTRFLILRNWSCASSAPLPAVLLSPASPSEISVQIKSIWVFTIAHHIPGSLAVALAVFARHNFNLSAIQSRPRPKLKVAKQPRSQQNGEVESINTGLARAGKDANWRYVFFVECLHTMGREAAAKRHEEEDVQIGELLEELKGATEQVGLLGSWRDRSP